VKSLLGHGEGPHFAQLPRTYKRLRGYSIPAARGATGTIPPAWVIPGKAWHAFHGATGQGRFTAAHDPTFNMAWHLGGAERHGMAIYVRRCVRVPALKDPGQTKAQQLLARVLWNPDSKIAFAQKNGSIACGWIWHSSSRCGARQSPAGFADAKAQVGQQ